MPRLFVFSIGYHENFAMRRLMSHHASRGDGILGFTMKPAAGAAVNAWGSLRTFALRLGISDHGLHELSCLNLAESSATARSMVEDLGYGFLVADLTGGPRCIVVAVLLGLLASGSEGEVWIQVEGGEGGEDRIPLAVLRVLREGVSRARRRMLAMIRRSPGVKPREIAEELGLSLKTVQNSLSELKKLGLIYQKGRGAGVYITNWGRLFT